MKRILPLLLACGLVADAIAADAKVQKPPSPAGLPDTIEKREVTIWSDGTRMVGDLYLPKDRQPEAKLPAVVFCNGTGGTRLHPLRKSPARLLSMNRSSGLRPGVKQLDQRAGSETGAPSWAWLLPNVRS